MPDRTLPKLGLKPPKVGLKLPAFRDKTGLYQLPKPHPSINWGNAVPAADWGVDMNLQLGCCTIAGVDHVQKVDRANVGLLPLVGMSNAEVEENYSVFGYVPGDPSTDQGAMLSEVLKYWMTTGFKINGRIDKILGFVTVDASNTDEIKVAMDLFGGLVVGFAMPETAQNQAVWDVVRGAGALARPYSWGGHCTALVGYNPELWNTITWGAGKFVTPAFVGEYLTEVYAPITYDWLNNSGRAPSGFTLPQLEEYGQLISPS